MGGILFLYGFNFCYYNQIIAEVSAVDYDKVVGDGLIYVPIGWVQR